MRVTTRARYAIRALYDLAFHRRGQPAQAKEIARRQQIPLRYLEQILQELRKAGLVAARRGPRGGYALARPPAEVSLADVLRATRGPLAELFAITSRAPDRGSRGRPAPPSPTPPDDVPAQVWLDVRTRLVDVLERATLQDFVARAEATGVARAVSPSTMYFI